MTHQRPMLSLTGGFPSSWLRRCTRVRGRAKCSATMRMRPSAGGIAGYINTIATAGKAEYPLPMYVNTWIGTPDSAMRPGFNYPSGGSTPNMLDIWEVAAPSIDFEAPDLYLPNLDMCLDTLQRCHRSANALYIPEMIGFSTRGK